MAAIQDEEAEQRKQSKAAKKAAFDDAYDEGAGAGATGLLCMHRQQARASGCCCQCSLGAEA